MTDPDSTSKPQSHTDIRHDGQLVACLPVWAKPYAHLARLDRPIGTWLLLLPALWTIALASGGISGMGRGEWRIAACFIVGAVIMRSAGCVVNDLWDRDIDRQVERTAARPLASGTISTRQALAFLFLLLSAGLAILLSFNGVTIALGILAAMLVVVYPLAKRVTAYPQFVLGLTFNMGALMGWSAVTGQIAWPAVALYIGGVFWTLGYDTIYAHQDMRDDAMVGIGSTALKFGQSSPVWIAGFYILAAFFSLGAGVIVGGGVVFYGLWICSAVHLAYQLYRWRPDRAASSLAIFRSNRDYGLILAAACAYAFMHI